MANLDLEERAWDDQQMIRNILEILQNADFSGGGGGGGGGGFPASTTESVTITRETSLGTIPTGAKSVQFVFIDGDQDYQINGVNIPKNVNPSFTASLGNTLEAIDFDPGVDSETNPQTLLVIVMREV